MWIKKPNCKEIFKSHSKEFALYFVGKEPSKVSKQDSYMIKTMLSLDMVDWNGRARKEGSYLRGYWQYSL